MAALDANQGLLRFITCGSVDDGKSTLLGRLLYDAGMEPNAVRCLCWSVLNFYPYFHPTSMSFTAYACPFYSLWRN